MDSSTSRRHAALVLTLIFGAIYLLWPTKNYYWDGVAFAVVIERAQHWPELFSVHHLLYEFVGAGFYRLFGGHIRALYLMQAFNALVAVAILALSYRLFRDLGVPLANSIAWTAVIGAAATFWKYATDADSYMLANMFLLAAFLFLLPNRPPMPLRVAALHVAAMMFHQLAALFYPVVLFCLWRQARDKRIARVGFYAVLAPAVTLAMYVWAYRSISNPEAPTFTAWVTYHAKVPFFFDALNNAIWMAKGTLRLFIGGKVGRLEWSAPTVLSTTVLLIALAAAIIHLVRLRQRPSPVDEPALFAWAAVYLTFLFFWEPYNTFYRLFYLVPLVAILARSTVKWDARLIGYPAVALLFLNFTFYIYPNTLEKNNLPLTVAMKHRKVWPGGTGVVFAQFVPDLWTISYFNSQAAWIALEQPDAAKLQKYVEAFGRDGGTIWVDWTYLQKSGEQVPPFTFREVGPGKATSSPALPSALAQ